MINNEEIKKKVGVFDVFYSPHISNVLPKCVMSSTIETDKSRINVNIFKFHDGDYSICLVDEDNYIYKIKKITDLDDNLEYHIKYKDIEVLYKIISTLLIIEEANQYI